MKTRAEKHAAATREVALRLKVYPSRIEAGKMTNDEARHEVICMREIAADYAPPDMLAEMALVDRVAGALFLHEVETGSPLSAIERRRALIAAGPSDELNAALAPFRARAKAAIAAVRGE